MISQRARLAICCAYFFLAMTGYYILKPVRESLFLNRQGLDQVPWVHLVVSVITLVSASLYAMLVRRIERRRLVALSNPFFVLSILGFWSILEWESRSGRHLEWIAWVYYVWVAEFAVFVPTLFWSLAHDLFTPEEGGRLYGVIGGFGILGGMLGGHLTHRFAVELGSVRLLVVAAAFLIPCYLLGVILGRVESARGEPVVRPPLRGTTALGLFKNDLYVCGIGLIVLLYQTISVLADYQTKGILKDTLGSMDLVTRWFGGVYLGVNGVGLAVSLFLTGPVQTRFGPLPGLLTFPLIAFGGALVVPGYPVLPVVTAMTVLGLGLSYSIHQASRELLYLPTATEVKFVAKGFIDTFLFRMGNALAAIWILWARPLPGSVQLCGTMALLALVMAAAAVRLSREHPVRVAAAAKGAGA